MKNSIVYKIISYIVLVMLFLTLTILQFLMEQLSALMLFNIQILNLLFWETDVK